MGQLAVKWAGGDSQLFIGRDDSGHVVVTGKWIKEGDESWTEWKAVKPSDLLVLGLAACSGYDVVMIMKRQRQELSDLTIAADAEQAPDPPYAFTHIHLHYVVSGHDLDPKKVERAITLSQEKYCSVAATIRGVTEITHSFEVCA
ncbi:MAG: OsmC family protein [Anaerolineales bacterium]|nr:OsmC family protein [Anaerolineales bacterium]